MIAMLLSLAFAEPVREEVKVGSRTRTFWVDVPQSVKPRGKRGAVVVFHGAGPDKSAHKGAKFRRATQMHVAAAEYGAVTVFADGVDGAWYPPEWAPEGVDDVAFAKKIYGRLVKKYGVAPNRVTAAGFSSGGHMAMQWACADRRVAGLVVVGATLSKMQKKRCNLGGPTPTLVIMGREDPINPYEGGVVDGIRDFEGAPKRVEVLSALGSGAYFAKKNGCAKPARTSAMVAPNGQVYGDKAKHRKCRKGNVEVISTRFAHVWPLANTKFAAKGASAYIAKFLKKRVWTKKLR